MWDVEPEIFDLNMTLNAMSHLNLLEDVQPLVQTSAPASNILGRPSSIHDVELQYVNDEDVDPFQDMQLDLLYTIILVECSLFFDETLNFVFTITPFYMR